MIPLCIPNMAGNEAAYLAECVTSTFVSTVGPFVGQFERMVSKVVGTPASVATSSGTTGLHAALLAAGVQRDDLVICPTLTFIASANAIAHCGAMPWLIDVEKQSWCLDSALMAEALTRETEARNGQRYHIATGRRISAVLPVFTLGTPADMDAIVPIAREAGLAIVVDAAAALGASYKGRPSGALGADLTMYSFNGNKTVTAGGGGCITGEDESLVAKVRHLTTTARVGADYDHDVVGYNYRMTNLQAAVGCAQMEMLDTFIAAKRRIAADYRDGLKNLPDVSFFPDPAWGKNVYWFSGFFFQSDDGAERSRSLRAFLRESGIDARPFWKPMHLQAPYADAPRTSVEYAENLWQRVVTLPCSTHLSRQDQDRVMEAIRTWFRQEGR